MDDVELAVLLSLDPTAASAELRATAVKFVEDVQQSSDGWRFCLQRLLQPQPQRDEVRFWCFDVIQAGLSRGDVAASGDDREKLRAAIVALVAEGGGTPYRDELSTASRSAGPHFPLPYVRNKCAQVFVTLLAADYPERWPNAMREGVLPLLQYKGGTDDRAENDPEGGAKNAGAADSTADFGVDMYFRVLQSLDEDVTSKRAAELDMNRARRVKDALRDDVIVELCSSWQSLLASRSARLRALSLDVIRRFVEWADIGLLLSGVFLTVVRTELLAAAYAVGGGGEDGRGEPLQDSNASTQPKVRNGKAGRESGTKAQPLRASAAAALRAMIAKGMPADQKLQLLQSIGVVDMLNMLRAADMSNDVSAVEADLKVASPMVEVARMVNQVAMEAIECMLVMKSAEASAIAQAALPMALRLMSDEDDAEGGAETIEFVNTYVKLCKSMSGNDLSENDRSGLGVILSVIIERSQLPMDSDEFLDSELGFWKLRIRLLTLFKNISRTSPPLALRSIDQIFSLEHSLPLEKQEPARAELAYTLLDRILEINNGRRDDPLDEMIALVLTNPVACVQEKVVESAEGKSIEQRRSYALLALLSLSCHAHRVVTARHALLSHILPPFFDRRGLRHPFAAHRSRAAALLLKLVTNLRATIAENHLEAFVSAAQSILSSTTAGGSVGDELSEDDQLPVYEALGLLLGIDNNDESREIQLDAMLQPLSAQLRAAAVSQAADKGGSSAAIEQALGCALKAANLAKGFPSQSLNASGSADGAANGGRTGEADGGAAPSLRKRLVELWSLHCGAVVAFYMSFPDIDEAKFRVMVFVQSVTETLGLRVLPHLAELLPVLLQHVNSAVQLTRLLDLVNQTAVHFREQAESLLHDLYLPLVTRVLKTPLLNVPRLAASEEARETYDLLRTFLGLLFSILSRGLHRLMISSSNVSALESTVRLVMLGAVAKDIDHQYALYVMRLCFQILVRMVTVWVPPGDIKAEDSAAVEGYAALDGFDRFVVENFGAVCVESALRGVDAVRAGAPKSAWEKVMVENVALQMILARRCGQPFCEYSASVVLPAAGCDAKVAREYVYLMSREDSKAVLRAFVALMQQMTAAME